MSATASTFDIMGDDYLREASRMVCTGAEARWFIDKMPLN